MIPHRPEINHKSIKITPLMLEITPLKRKISLIRPEISPPLRLEISLSIHSFILL